MCVDNVQECSVKVLNSFDCYLQSYDDLKSAKSQPTIIMRLTNKPLNPKQNDMELFPRELDSHLRLGRFFSILANN